MSYRLTGHNQPIVGKRREGEENKKKEDFASALADGDYHLLQ